MTNSIKLKRCLPVMGYFGGKSQHRDWINSCLPCANAYVEVFSGSAAVGLARKPSPIEIFNDVDVGVANLYRVIQSDSEELAMRVRFTLFSREEHEQCKAAASQLGSRLNDPIESARQHLVLVRQSFSSVFSGSWGYGRRGGGGSFHGATDLIAPVARRLADATITNFHFRDLIEKYRHLGADAAWYFDPPYLPESRVTKEVYRHEMSHDEHEEMLSLIVGLSGMVVLSGYPSPLYDDALIGWERQERNVACMSSNFGRKGAFAKARRTECLWINPAAQERIQTDSHHVV